MIFKAFTKPILNLACQRNMPYLPAFIKHPQLLFVTSFLLTF